MVVMEEINQGLQPTPDPQHLRYDHEASMNKMENVHKTLCRGLGGAGKEIFSKVI